MDLENIIQPQVDKSKIQLKKTDQKVPFALVESKSYPKPDGSTEDFEKKPIDPVEPIGSTGIISNNLNIESSFPKPDGSIEDFEERIEPIVPIPKSIINEEERKKYASDRVKELDKEKEKLRQEIKNLNKKKTIKSDYSMAKMGSVPGDENGINTAAIDEKIKKIEERIAQITPERREVKRIASPITPEMQKEISDGMSISRDSNGQLIPPNFFSIFQKYGIDKINEAHSDYWNKVYNDEQKLSIRNYEQLKQVEGAFTMSALKYSPITTPEEEQKPLMDVFEQMQKTAEWNGNRSVMPLTRQDRYKIAAKTIKEYVNTKFKDSEPEFKKAKEFEYAKIFNAGMMWNKNGKPTVEGIQTFAIDQQANIIERIGVLTEREDELQALAKEGKLNGQESYLEYISNEKETLQVLQQINQKILDLPIKRSGLHDVAGMFNETGAIGSISMSDLASLGIRDIKRLLEVKRVSERLEKGESLSWAEQRLLETYSSLQEASGQDTKGILYQALQGIVDMVPYFATFGVTKWAVYKPVNKLVNVAATKIIPQSLIKKSVYYFPDVVGKILGTTKINLAESATKWAGRGIGAIAQTAANYPSIEKYASETEIPEMQTSLQQDEKTGLLDLITTLDKNTGLERDEALREGFFKTLGDIGFEHSGDYLFKAAKMPGRTIAYYRGKPITKELLVDNIVRVGGYKSFKELFEKVTKEGWGWHQPMEEYMEELATQIFQVATTRDKFGPVNEFLEQQLVTVLTVVGAGQLQSSVGSAIKYKMFGDIGDDVAYTTIGVNGKEGRFTIPKMIHDQLQVIFNEGDLIDPVNLNNFLDKFIDNHNVPQKGEKILTLNQKQTKFILSLALQEAEKKGQLLLLKKTLLKNGIGLEDNFWTDAETLSEKEFNDTQKRLSAKEFARIEKKNEEISKKYPLLAEQNLLPMSATGQFVEPTIEYLLSLQDQINKTIEEKGQQYENGEYKNPNTKYISELQTEIKELQDEEQTPEVLKQIEGLTAEIQDIKKQPSPEFIDAVNQQKIVEQELEDLSERIGVPFNFQNPSKKFELLLERIYNGEKLTGKGTLIKLDGTTMLVTLENGDQVRAYLGPEPGINETMEQYKARKILAQRASRLDLPLTIEHQAKDDWNPNDEAKERIFDPVTGKMTAEVPYGDRLNIVSEGKVIGAVEIHDYNDKDIKAARYRKAMQMANKVEDDIISNLSILPDDEKIPEGDNTRLKKLVEDLIFDLKSNLNIKPSETFDWLTNNTLKNKLLSDKQKLDVINYLNTNKQAIIDDVTRRRAKEAGMKVKEVPLELTEFESSDAVAQSSAQKLNEQLKTFFPLWKAISEWKVDNKLSRENIEDEFFNMVSRPSFNEVIDEATYINWLTKNTDLNKEGQLITEYLLLRNSDGSLTTSWEKILSATCFYRNVKKVKQVGIVITKEGVRVEDLNPGQSYEDFLIDFHKSIESHPEGIGTVMRYMKDHVDERNKRFIYENLVDDKDREEFSITGKENDDIILERKRAKLKKEQFESDLYFLERVTGISFEIWNSYFYGKTNETIQYADRDLNTNGKKMVDFGSYDEILNRNSYRRQSDGTPRSYQQSNLMFNLLLLNKEKVEDKFLEKFVNFFTKGKGSREKGNMVFSNLYKLSTSRKDIGSNGQDIKGDNFSSFQLYSDLYNTADNILDSNLGNRNINGEEIYKLLGNKTASNNVRIENWGNLKDLREPFTKAYDSIVHVISTRIKNSNQHFGNIFTHDPTGKMQGLITVGSVKEAVIKYIDWVINSNDERAKWIRNEIQSGRLKDKPILYYKELGEPSHATALDYLINKYDWNKSNGNSLVNYYKTIGSPMELIIINGIHNRKLNKFDKGTSSIAMSMEDIWVSLMSQFATGKDTYLQNIGQFADKPYIYTVKTPKIFMPTKEQIQYVDSILNGGFENSVNTLYSIVGLSNSSMFQAFSKDYPLAKGIDMEQNAKIKSFITAFVYNYAINQKDLNEIFFGYIANEDIDGYKSITDMFKRAGSTNSPGFRLNTNVTGGVGKTFRFAVINDKNVFDSFGELLSKNGMDGCVFYSDEIGRKMQVSMGRIYSKKNKYPELTTTKALISSKNKITNKRCLVKGNWYNIDVLSKEGDSPTSKIIRDFMKEHKIDVLGVGTSSSVKILDEGIEIPFFNEKGEINQNILIDQNEHIKDKYWDDVYIQQDLRHSINPKTAKSPSQNLTTLLGSTNGARISQLAYRSQQQGIHELLKEFTNNNVEETKRQWLIDNINEHSQPELLELLNKGLSISDPVYRKIIRTILASAVSRNALELPINRIVAIEIPDIDNQLSGMKKVTGLDGKEHIMLAECGASVPGARTFNYKFEGNVQGAIDYIMSNKDKYNDLFDSNGELMSWEISGRNGIIPGEVIALARVPNSGFSTLTYARLKVNFEKGNFAMLDRESRLRGSADFDGDQRYVQTTFKQNGFVIENGTQEGISNEIMKLAIDSYTQIDMYEKLTHGINPDLYNKIIDKLTNPSYNGIDPLAFQQARLNNKVGLDMKGGMTNLLTVYSILSKYNIPFRKQKHVEYNGIEHFLSGIANDEYGAIRAHLENFLTMFFDNQKDPKVERMGFNEITGNMFILMLIGKPTNGVVHISNTEKNFKNFKQHYQYLIGQVEEQVTFFNSPLLVRFKSEMRRENGGMRKKDENEVFKSLTRSCVNGKWTAQEVKALKTLYTASKELGDIKKLHTLTQSVPNNYSDFILAKELVKKVRSNDPKTGFKLFNLRSFINPDGTFIPEFRIIDDVLKFCEEKIFDDIPESTIIGNQIYAYVLNKLKEVESNKPLPEGIEFRPEKTSLTKKELDALNSSINNAFNIKAIGLNEVFSVTEKKLIKKITDEAGNKTKVINPKFFKEFPGNSFLNFITIDESGNLTIIQEFTHGKIKETTLNKIREDFDLLSKEIKDLFATYQIQKYGSTTKTSNGGFYTLFGPEYKIELSKRTRTEMYNWMYGDLSSMERLAIADWVLRGNRLSAIKELQNFTESEDRFVNFRSDPSLQIPIHRDTLEGIESINDVNEYNTINGPNGATQDLFDWSLANTTIPSNWTGTKIEWFNQFGMNFKHIITSLRPVVTKHLTKRRSIAEKHFPQGKSYSDDELQNMHSSSDIMQLMMSYDKGLNDYIYDHLRKKYPNVNIFTDRQAFVDYVRKCTNETVSVDINAIGHAFRNAVYIDPTRPIQETLFHEHSHIYWNALPTDHVIKTALRQIYRAEYGNKLSLGAIDEKIVTDIGRLGTEYAEDFMDMNFYEKIVAHLIAFWNAVRIAFGNYNKQDLVADMVYDIWNNRANVKPNSRIGSAQIDNLIVYNNAYHNIMINNKIFKAFIGNISLTGITNMINLYKYDKFDSDKTQAQLVKEFENDFIKTYNRPPNDEDVFAYSEYIIKSWEDSAKRGTANHLIAREVFSGEKISEKEEKENFNVIIKDGVSISAADQLRGSFGKLKLEILAQYPQAKFITEKPIISIKHYVFGYVDLIVDIGDGHLLIYDFKTTSEEYKNNNGELSEYYRKQYGFMMGPMKDYKQSKEVSHKLQLSIEAQILEEQINEDNPDEKNIVDGMFIVPIISILKNGKQNEVHISEIIDVPGQERDDGRPIVRVKDNLIEVDVANNAYKKLAEKMLIDHAKKLQDKNISGKYVILKDLLDKTNLIPWTTKEELLKAYSYFSMESVSDLSSMERDTISSIRNNGYRFIYNTLLMNNFTTTDEIEVDETDDYRDPLNTTNINRLPFEVQLYCAIHNYTAVEWLANRKTWYKSTNVGSDSKLRLNPNYIDNKEEWFHKKMNGNDYYFHSVGTHTSKLVGKEMIRITSMKIGDFTTPEHPEFFKIVKVNKKDGTIKIINTASGVEETISNVEKQEGILIINTKKEATDHGVTENNYVPKYLETKQTKYELHWQTPYTFDNTAHGIKTQQRHFIAQKKMWEFFNTYNSKGDIRKLIEDKDTMKFVLAGLYSVKTEGVKVADPLINFLGQECMNSIMAEQIRFENRNGPQINMPMLINLYKICTLKDDAIFSEFSGYNRSANWWAPTRKIQSQHIGINWFLSSHAEALIKLGKINTDNNFIQNKFFNNINQSSIVITLYGKKHFKLPNDESLRGDSFKKEREYLNFLYEQKYKYVPKYIAALKKYSLEGKTIQTHGYPQLIMINRNHATRHEVITAIGERNSRWGNVIFDIMTDNTYDNIKLKIEDKIVTFKDIKDLFSIETASPQEIEEWMGKTTLGFKPKYWLRKIPGLRLLGEMSKPKLLGYYQKAKSIYENGDTLNDRASETGSMVSTPVDTHVKYETNYLLEAQAKELEADVNAYFIQDLIGPLDWALNGYHNTKNAYAYLKRYTDLIMFRKNDKLGSEWTAFADALQQLTSLRFISFSPMTQLYNFTVGQTQDIVREPIAYTRGVGRFMIPSNPVDLLTSIPAGAAAGTAIGSLIAPGIGSAIGAGIGGTTGALFSPRKVLKAINILRSHGLGNIVDEARFDTLAKRAGLNFKWKDRTIANLSYESFITLGFLPMEIVERFNQVPLFIGLMTKEEWDSYDDNGILIKGHEGLTSFRAGIISDRVRDVQGDYTPKNAAPLWNTSGGALAMQFGKWAPTLIDSMIMPYHLDKNYMVRSGTLPTIALMGKITKFVVLRQSEEKKYEYLKKALMRWPDANKAEQYNNWVKKTFGYSEELMNKHLLDLNKLPQSVKDKQSQFIHNSQEYFQMLLVASNEGNLKITLSPNDKRNLLTTALRVVTYALLAAKIYADRKKLKVEKVFETDWESFMTKFLVRYQSDLFIWTGKSPDPMGPSWGGLFAQKIANPIMALDVLLKSIIFVDHFTQSTLDVAGHLKDNWFDDDADYLRQWWRPDVARYTKNTANALEGESKVFYEFAGLIPTGNALNFLAKQRVKYELGKPYLQSLRNNGYDPEDISKLTEYIDESISIGEIKKLSDRYDAYINILKISSIVNAVEGSEIVYKDLINGKNLLETTYKQVQKAAKMIDIVKEHSLDQSAFREAVDDLERYKQFMKKGINQTDSEIIRKFNEAIEKYDFDPDILQKKQPKRNIDGLLDMTTENKSGNPFKLFSTNKK